MKAATENTETQQRIDDEEARELFREAIAKKVASRPADTHISA